MNKINEFQWNIAVCTTICIVYRVHCICILSAFVLCTFLRDNSNKTKSAKNSSVLLGRTGNLVVNFKFFGMISKYVFRIYWQGLRGFFKIHMQYLDNVHWTINYTPITACILNNILRKVSISIGKQSELDFLIIYTIHICYIYFMATLLSTFII